MVNRVWLWHFGRGLVNTPNDFGKRGEAPTHPELLDYLTSRFIDSGWSLKKLHKDIMLTRAYATASGTTRRTRSRMRRTNSTGASTAGGSPPRSCAIRCLQVSGQLDPTPGGAHPFPPRARVTCLRSTIHSSADVGEVRAQQAKRLSGAAALPPESVPGSLRRGRCEQRHSHARQQQHGHPGAVSQ